jgi:hypothetical protein
MTTAKSQDELATWLQVYMLAGTIKAIPNAVALQLRGLKYIDYNTPNRNLRITDEGKQFIEEYRNGLNKS